MDELTDMPSEEAFGPSGMKPELMAIQIIRHTFGGLFTPNI